MVVDPSASYFARLRIGYLLPSAATSLMLLMRSARSRRTFFSSALAPYLLVAFAR